jgi:hypothetical protein
MMIAKAASIFLPQIFLPWGSHANFIARADPPDLAA